MYRMDRDQALQAMIDGFKITHHSFADDEFIHMKGQNIFTEEGYNVGTVNDEFWQIRNGLEWQDGWEYYG